MNQRCYTGEHASVYTPLGVIGLVLVCALPPMLVLWLALQYLVQQRNQGPVTMRSDGFLVHQHR